MTAKSSSRRSYDSAVSLLLLLWGITHTIDPSLDDVYHLINKSGKQFFVTTSSGDRATDLGALCVTVGEASTEGIVLHHFYIIKMTVGYGENPFVPTKTE
jgi:hypothetical protein